MTHSHFCSEMWIEIFGLRGATVWRSSPWEGLSWHQRPDLCLGAPVVPQDYLSEGGSILFLVGEGGEGLHVRTLSDFCWGENQRFLREKKTTHKGFWVPNDPMSMILGYFGFQMKVEYSGITFYNSIYIIHLQQHHCHIVIYCLCFIELGVLWLPAVPAISFR